MNDVSVGIAGPEATAAFALVITRYQITHRYEVSPTDGCGQPPQDGSSCEEFVRYR
jgi:hypothetical protein